MKRSTSKQKPVLGMQLPNSLRSLTVFVFNFMRLVDYNIFPIKFHQSALTESYSFKSGNAHVKLAWLELGFEDLFSLFLACDEVEDSTLWKPLFEFKAPVADDGLGHDDQVIAIDKLEFLQKAN